jgi:hypothetical protein
VGWPVHKGGPFIEQTRYAQREAWKRQFWGIFVALCYLAHTEGLLHPEIIKVARFGDSGSVVMAQIDISVKLLCLL